MLRFALAAGLLAAASPIHALTLQSTVISTYARVNAKADSDFEIDKPVQSSATDRFVTALAVQKPDGYSELSIAAKGASTSLGDAIAYTSITLNYRNTGTTTENAAFDFALSNLRLRTTNPNPRATPKAHFQFDVVLEVDGLEVNDFSAQATLRDPYTRPEFTHSNLPGTLTEDICVGTVCVFSFVDLSPISGALSFGNIRPGQTASARIQMEGRAAFTGGETLAEVFAGDPNGTSALSYSVSNAAPAPVPLPAGMTLSLTALSALALARRRTG